MKRLALVAALAAFSVSAFADIVGTYVVGDGQSAQKTTTMTISYKDDQNIRMDVGQGTYMLVAGAKVYMVTTQGGQTTVMDMDSLPKFAQPQPKAAKARENVKVTKTGRSETIAGIKGDVYEITWDNQKHEAVLSNDKRMLGLNKAFTALAKRMGQTLGAETQAQIDVALGEAQKYGYGGLLRSDRNMVLQSVGEKAQPAGFYALPKGAAPMQMPQFDPAMMQQMQQQMMQMQKQQGGQ